MSDSRSVSGINVTSKVGRPLSLNSKFAIETTVLSRHFRSYKKPEGFINSVKGLFHREYTDRAALAPTTLKIEAGKIVGLVGANGAGKTTLLKLLSGLIFPSSGEARVLGYVPWERDYRFLRQMGILLGQKNQLWWDISPVDSYALLAKIYDIDLRIARQRVRELAERLDCTHVLEVQLRRLSLGERMKMEVIGALLHNPKILFLDEPTIGLDVIAQESIRDFLKSYQQAHHPTIILTSHYMDDIAKLSDQLLLIRRGEIVYQGSVDEFTLKSDIKQKLYLRIEDPPQQPEQISFGLQIEAHQSELVFEVENIQVAQIIGEVAKLHKILKFQLEEVDFEEVIKVFLEKESRIL